MSSHTNSRFPMAPLRSRLKCMWICISNSELLLLFQFPQYDYNIETEKTYNISKIWKFLLDYHKIFITKCLTNRIYIFLK